jgi:hypothetical protein
MEAKGAKCIIDYIIISRKLRNAIRDAKDKIEEAELTLISISCKVRLKYTNSIILGYEI